MTVVMAVVMGVMMVGMMFGMHRKHKGKHGGADKPVVSSTATAQGSEAAPHEHAH
ncbi:MAG: hypothetical protein HY928_02575 [Elusimicrobia bacterium]|nr:hypothetical protein [Elusimicrobiota bacterium]